MVRYLSNLLKADFMNYRKYIFAAAFLSISLPAFAQDQTDAFRYSYLSPSGTARSIGFGSALGSVGGDFSSLAVNPAGIGIYRSSEFTFTPSIKMNSTQGTYMGNTTNDNNVRFNFNNLGAIFSRTFNGQREERTGWRSVSWGFGITRLADFNRDYNYNANNSGPNSSSYSELFAIDANSPTGNVNDPSTLGGMAYASNLITYDSANGYYKTLVPWQDGINQKRVVTERGGINEFDIAVGGNYMDKLMIGGTLGIPIVNYTRDAAITEAALTPTNEFNSYTYSEHLETRGSGVNLKLGLIYKPNNDVRFGVAIHTPTYYTLHDDYNTSLNNSGLVSDNASTYDYHLVTPWRAVLSATVFAGKKGFISADYEYVNYSSAKFIFDANNKDYQSQINSVIANSFQGGSIVRLGGELKLTNFFMVRAGFGYYGNPYSGTSVSDANRIDLSGGIGFRFQHMFIDLAYLHTQFSNPEEFYALYYTNATIIQNATIKNNLNSAVMTIGFKL
jgi:hypothetical protein